MLRKKETGEGSVISMETKICPETGQKMTRGIRPMTLTYKNVSETFDMPGWYTEDGEHGLFTSEDTKISDRVLIRMKATANGILFPEEIKRIRKKLKLTQEKAGEYIGGGPRAFQKYEAGTLLPSKAISNFLEVLDNYPEAAKLLKREEGKTIIEAAAM